MAKNEYESSQIIMTPDYDVKSYDVTVRALTHSNGTDTIPAESIGVYVEKYLSLGVVYDTARARNIPLLSVRFRTLKF